MHNEEAPNRTFLWLLVVLVLFVLVSWEDISGFLGGLSLAGDSGGAAAVTADYIDAPHGTYVFTESEMFWQPERIRKLVGDHRLPVLERAVLSALVALPDGSQGWIATDGSQAVLTASPGVSQPTPLPPPQPTPWWKP